MHIPTVIGNASQHTEALSIIRFSRSDSICHTHLRTIHPPATFWDFIYLLYSHFSMGWVELRSLSVFYFTVQKQKWQVQLQKDHKKTARNSSMQTLLTWRKNGLFFCCWLYVIIIYFLFFCFLLKLIAIFIYLNAQGYRRPTNNSR